MRGLLVLLSLPVLVDLVSAQQVILRCQALDGPGDLFGQAVQSAGDVDKDGVPDFAIGAPQGSSTNHRGYVQVWSGKTRTLIRTIRGVYSYERFGYSLAAAGDLNGDTWPDLLVGIPERWTSGQPYGAVEARSGKDGSFLYSVTGEGNENRLGLALCALGDVDQDGVPDFAAATASQVKVYSGKQPRLLHVLTYGLYEHGIPTALATVGDVNKDGAADHVAGYSGYLSNAGQVRLFSGSDGKILQTWSGDSQQQSLFGQAVGAAGDVDKDGVPDVIVGIPNETDPRTQLRRGGTAVFSGRTFKELHHVYGGTKNGSLGSSVAPAGDLNGDGCADFAVGDPGSENPDKTTGSVIVYSGLDASILCVVTGKGGSFGKSQALLGDVDGDGKADLIVGAPAEPLGGAAYVVSIVGSAQVEVIGKPCSNSLFPPSLLSTKPVLGQQVQVGGQNAPPIGLLLISPPLPAPIPLARDCDLYLDPTALLFLALVPNAGTWTVRLPLPDDIRLMSVRISVQVLHLQTVGPLGFDLTNALHWLLGY